MQFISALFGGQENLLLNAAFALGAVLVLVLLCLWVVKLVLGLRTGLPSRRGRRLAVIESLQLDARHRVSIIRRDNVEHVILTGGTQDVVIESGIAVERPVPRRVPPRPAMPRTAGVGQVPVAGQPVPPAPAGPAESVTDPSAPVPAAAPSPPAGRPADAAEPYAATRSASVTPARLLRSTALRRSHVIPIQTQDPEQEPSDSATSEPEQEQIGQAKIGGASTSRFPGSTFNFEGH